MKTFPFSLFDICDGSTRVTCVDGIGCGGIWAGADICAGLTQVTFVDGIGCSGILAGDTVKNYIINRNKKCTY